MNSPAIKIENLSKKYRIGEFIGYRTFRELIGNITKASFSKFFSGNGELENSNREIETIWALKDISFEVNQGDVVGIIGRNGAGKSTLLKILSKITEPTTGRVELRGRIGSLLEVGTGFHPELSGHENIYLYGAILGMDRWEITRKFDEIVAFAEIERFVNTPVKRYSSGMYMRLAFAVAAHLESEILLVDEVLAVGDMSFQKKCLGKMEDVSKEGRTVLFVSHNMAAIEQLCDRAVLIDKGQIKHVGQVTETVQRYERDTMTSGFHSDRPLQIIYDLGIGDSEPDSDFAITRIETLDDQNRPKESVYTWDRVRFRIGYWARQEVQAGSAVLFISTRQGIHLLLCSTEPDSAVAMTIRAGYHAVECEFESMPLSAGDYIVGAGLAIPNKEWLCGESHMGRLVIHPRNVYESGLAPEASRSILAIPHNWLVDEYKNPKALSTNRSPIIAKRHPQ